MLPPLPTRPDAQPSPGERAAALERLLAWASANGASWDGIEFRVDSNGGAYVVATRALSRGDALLTLPQRLMIIDDQLDDSTTGAHPLGIGARTWDTLAAWVALEVKEPASRWRPYLDLLPARLDELPMFRDADELAALAGTAAHALVADTQRDIADTYSRLSPKLRSRLSLADFAWGRAIVMSRSLDAPGTFEHLSLLPLVDIFNHDHREDTTWSYNPFDGLVLRSEYAIEAGREVHFSYGERSNAHLLVHFGFTLPDTTANEAALEFELPVDAPSRVRVRASFDQRFVRALSLARLHACEPAARDQILATLDRPTNIPFLDGANEETAFDVLGTVARRAREKLDAVPPSASPRGWDRTCALVREGERAVLDRIIELASIARAYAHMADPRALQAAADAIAIDEAGARRMLRGYLQDRADEPEPNDG